MLHPDNIVKSIGCRLLKSWSYMGVGGSCETMNEYIKKKEGSPSGYPSESHFWKTKGFPKEAPQSAKTDSPHKSYPCLRGCFLGGSGSARRVGLTPQTLEVALIPLVRLVSASCHLCHKGLDGGRNDVASLSPFGAIRCSTTAGFSSGHLLGMPPSTSLVADPSRGHELACRRAENTGYHGNHLHHPLHPTSYFHKSWTAGQSNYSTWGNVVKNYGRGKIGVWGSHLRNIFQQYFGGGGLWA